MILRVDPKTYLLLTKRLYNYVRECIGSVLNYFLLDLLKFKRISEK